MKLSTPVIAFRLSSIVCAVMAVAPVSASDFDIVINEVHYNPASGDADDEFLELYNRGPTLVDLGGWGLTRGVTFFFPDGLTLEPKGFLLVSPNPGRTLARYGADAAVVGPYEGRLDNGGEVILLFNDEGDEIQRLHYEDGGVWANLADGSGPSLELISPDAQPDIPRHWASSLVIDGTPGAPNSRLESGPAADRVVIEVGETWAYRTGESPYPAGWTERGFDDGAWDEGPTGIGFGDGDDATVLGNMQGNYVSFAARKSFQLSSEDLNHGDLFLEIDYDDGFVAYVNGFEVARSNLGAPGTDVPEDQSAAPSHEAGSPESFPVTAGVAEIGDNVIAVQVHNSSVNSGDVSFIPRLVSRPGLAVEVRDRLPVRLNEVYEGEGATAGFIEIYNAGDEKLALGNFRIVDSAGPVFQIPQGTVLEPGAWLVHDETQLGFDVRLAGVTYLLVAADGETFVDALNPRAPPTGEVGLGFGRYPDGDPDGFLMRQVTAGDANRLVLPTSIVVNEFYFHPPYVPPGNGCDRECSDRDQWIELHNRSGSPVDVSGWRLTKGIDMLLPASTTIPAGGFLVVASSRQRFLATHPGFAPGSVVGDWTQNLAHDSDTINLRDELGNLVDHVKYGDGTPINDEDPEDDVDDRTFLGSEWPPGAQGSGRTVELIHPNLDNRRGHAWTEGPVGGTPGARNDEYDASPDAVVGAVHHSPAVPRSVDAVVVTCRVSATRAIAEVRALWHRDGGGGSGAAVLTDDGLGDDEIAGDGKFAGRIPAQGDGSVVAFQIEARLANGQVTVVPFEPEASPYSGFDGPYFLYQVLDDAPPANPSANYYVIMTQEDRDELEDRPEESNVLLPATFISLSRRGEPEIRYLAAIRYRGSSARQASRKSYRINFSPEKRFEDIRRLNLNAREIDAEILAADLFRRAGMPGPQQWTVNLTFTGDLDRRYVRKERLDGDFLDRYFGGASADGNLYRAIDPDDNRQFPDQGDLTYFGTDPDDYRPYYVKQTAEEEDDYSDIIALTRTFDPDETPDAEFADSLEAAVDVWQWARFFALQSCLGNTDGSIHNRTGEDYYLYRVPAAASGPNAGKWILLPWDLEESFSNDDEPLFPSSLDAVRRFYTHQRFAPFYYCNLMNVRHGVFSRRETRQRFALIDFLFDFGDIDALDRFVTFRLGFFDDNVPMELLAGPTDAGAGEAAGCGDDLYVTGDSIGLAGTSNACLTASLRVNGSHVDYDAFRAAWSTEIDIAPGENVITCESVDALGQTIQSTDIRVFRMAGGFTTVGGAITSNRTWTAANGPYLMTSNVQVRPGSHLTIEAGAVIFGAENASILVEGQLSALGTTANPILFLPRRCDERWGGIAFDDTGTGGGDPTQLLRGCHVRFGDNPAGFVGCIAPVRSKLLVDGCRFAHLTANAVDGTNARVEVRDSRFENIREGVHGVSSTVVVVNCHFEGMVGDTDAIDFDGDGADRSLIEGCTFVDGSDDGIDLGRTSVDIRDNVFINIQDKAMSLENNGSFGNPTITGNVVYNCGTAIALKNGVRVTDGRNNTLVGNQEGMNLFSKDGAPDGGHGVFHSMIVWDNIVDVQLDRLSTLDLSFSNVRASWPGRGNISLDPRFMNVRGGDFRLRPGSPCIGSGRDGVDMGALPFDGDPVFFLRGDADASGAVVLTDAVVTLRHLFQGGPPPSCPDSEDANDDGRLDVSDAAYILLFLFRAGEPPPAPFPGLGTDPTPDALTCF